MMKVDAEEQHLDLQQCLRYFCSSYHGKKILPFIASLILIVQCVKLAGQSKHSEVRYYHNQHNDQNNDLNALVTMTPKDPKNEDLQPLRILSMGGSVTWGSWLESRTDAYSYHLQSGSFVTNLALCASGSDYPSLCLNSMVNSDLERKGIKDIEGFTYNVITLEFSLNGMSGIDLLLDRLRQKYPSAIFVYVHLLSPRMSLRDRKTGKMPRDILEDKNLKFAEMDALTAEAFSDPNADWIWDEVSITRFKEMESVVLEKMKRFGGAVWSFPINNALNEVFPLFTSDRHHLNSDGHSLVAAGIRDIVRQRILSSEVGMSKLVHDIAGSWGKGDFCYTWFETGRSPLNHTGGKMKMFIKPDKFAHQMSIGNGISTVSVDNTMAWPMPLSVMYMVWHPQYYPKTKVTITSHMPNGSETSSEPFILNAIHPDEGMHKFHVTLTSKVGMANPGRNTVAFECLEKAKKPLRVTGIVMCGACVE